jgi:hypothetical protein
MTILTSATLVMELLWYHKGFGWMNDALHFFLEASLRKHEMEGKFTGSFYFSRRDNNRCSLPKDMCNNGQLPAGIGRSKCKLLWKTDESHVVSKVQTLGWS